VTHVAELVLGVGEPGAETSARALRGVEVPVAYARRRCLIDHLERMQEVLEEAGTAPRGSTSATRPCWRSRRLRAGTEGHQEHGGVEHVGVVVLNESPALRVPALGHDLAVDGVSRGHPAHEVAGQTALASDADRPLDRNPRHQP